MIRTVSTLLFALLGTSCGGTSGDPVAPTPAPRPPALHPAGASSCDDAPLRGFGDLEAADATQVAVDGVPRVAIACTEKECTDGRACCNSCEGEYVLLDAERQLNLRGLAGCSGMDCDTVCEPFGREPFRTYRFVGRYDHAQRVLHVDKYCRR